MAQDTATLQLRQSASAALRQGPCGVRVVEERLVYAAIYELPAG